MSNKLFIIFAFVAGGAAGFITANALLKTKYEQTVQDEIESIKSAFDRIHKDREEVEVKEVKVKEDLEKVREEKEAVKKEYKKVVESLGYSEEHQEKYDDKPYVISPDDFGSIDEYERISLTLYSDGTVTDDAERALSDTEIEWAIGKESLEHIGEYEEDSVCVRNNRLKADYEVLVDQRTYADILRDNPYLKL